tara:strand:- start:205 stop:510 length:306 start_codon:yes stop_codon:yes gene_type:complete
METLSGNHIVSRSEIANKLKHAKNLPTTISHVEIGRVEMNSSVPVRLSSLHILIVRAADKKIKRTGSHSKIGRTSAMFLAKNDSTQKNKNRVMDKKAPKNR